ncbi:(pine wood nematode) hypothetical protein [Aphelenchoides bicaudatus]|nr:(pine wood nematode) hypothetical protein [Aphelenchoides bicaudatus]
MTWGIAYVINNQNVQQKLHEELDKVIGSDRLILVADRQQLHYTQAVIMEIQRVANIFAMNLPRKAAKDVVVNGCLIKGGTIVFPQISVIMQDPNVFKNPKEFNPDRYIDENGQFVPVSRSRSFLAWTTSLFGRNNIFNQYKLLPGAKPPTLRKKGSGGSIATEPYKVRVERRRFN